MELLFIMNQYNKKPVSCTQRSSHCTVSWAKEDACGQIAYLFPPTIRISVEHACLTHRVHFPPPLHFFPYREWWNPSFSRYLTNIHYIPQPLTSLLIRATHCKLAAAITGNIKHRLCWAPCDRYYTDHRQTPAVIGIITVGTTARSCKRQIQMRECTHCWFVCTQICSFLPMQSFKGSSFEPAETVHNFVPLLPFCDVHCDYFPT